MKTNSTQQETAGTKSVTVTSIPFSTSVSKFKISVSILLTVMFLFAVQWLNAQATKTASTGNWNNAATWTPSGVPGTNDSIIIPAGVTLTGNVTTTVRALTFGNLATTTATLSVNSGVTITVTNRIQHLNDDNQNTTASLTGSGTVICAELCVGNPPIDPTAKATYTTTFTSSISNLTITGNLDLNGQDAGGGKKNESIFNLSSGTVTVGGTLRLIGQKNVGCTFTMATGSQNATLRFTGATPFSFTRFDAQSGTIDYVFDLSGTGTTVDYAASASAQTIPFTYSSQFSNGAYNSVALTYTNLKSNNTHANGATLGAAVTATNVTGNLTVGDVNTGSLLNTNNVAVTRPNSRTITVAAGSTFNAGTTSMVIGTGSTVTINGTFRTADADGFSGSGTTAIRSTNSPTITLGAASTIEYTATSGTQTVTARSDYANLTLSGAASKTLAGNSTLSGNLTTAGGGFALSTFTLTVNDDITNNVAITGTGKVLLSGGAVAHAISGSGSFTNLELSDSFGATLGDNETVNGTLTLTSGLITTNAFTLTVASTGSITGQSASAYVNGKLARVIAGTTTTAFPIGKGGFYRPLNFTYATAPAAARTVTIEQFESVYPAVPSNASTARFGNRYWNITQSATGTNYTVQLNNGGATPVGTVVMVRREGTGSTTSNATSFSSPNYSNTSSFSTTNVSNDVALCETSIPVTITGLTGANKTYDGTTTASVTGTAALSGVVSPDVVTITGTPVYTFANANVANGISITTTGYTLGGANAGAYTLTQPSFTANITKATLTVTADNQSKVYGAVNPSLTVTYTGYVNGQTFATSGVTGTPSVTTTATAASGVGAYPISVAVGTLAASNYQFSYVAGTLTVTAATLTVTASAQSKVYGTTVASAGVLNTTYTVNGLQNSDAANGATLGYSGSPAGNLATAAAGTYTITPSALTLSVGSISNYSISYVTGTLTVSKASLTIAALDQSKTYGSSISSTPVVNSNYTVTGLQNSDAVSSLTLSYTGSPAGNLATASVGTYTITPSAVSFSSGSTSNYTISYTSATLTVSTATLTVTASAQSKVYGTTVSTTGTLNTNYTISGIKNSDAIGSLTLSYSGTPAGNLEAAAVGTYTITPLVVSFSSGTASNYTISYITGTLTVGNKVVTITANDQSKNYGTAISLGTTAFTASSMVGSDAVTSVTLTSTGVDANAAAGTYSIVPSAVTGVGNLSNYTFNYVNGTLTVNKVTLTVTAKDSTRTYNGVAFTGGNGVTYSGFVNNETASVLSGTLSYAGTAQNAKNAGTYTIVPQGLSSDNYSFSYANGTLTISKAALNIVAKDTSKNQGVSINNGTTATGFTASGLVSGETIGTVLITFGDGKAANAEPGVYDGSVVPSAATGGTFLAANYNISYTAGSLNVYTVVGLLPAYRTRAAGDFSNINTWEVEDFPDWVPADQVPTSGSDVEIRHAVNLDMNYIVGRSKNFTITGTGTLTINAGKIFSVEGTANFGGKAVVLKSTSQGTASIGQIIGTLTGATNVTVERYIGNSKRAWRILTIPVTGTTIRQAWAGRAANGNVPTGETAGSGTLLTGHFYTNGTTSAAAGYDWFTANVNQPSNIRFYSFVNGAGSWASATNTPNVLNAPDKQGYMVFIRGDRTIASGTNASNTTLRPTGTLKTGNQTVAVNEQYVVVGNPYASAISMEKVFLNTGNSNLIERNFWIWDARLGASGGYRALSWNGTSYDVTGGGNASQLLIIESGGAFFVQRKSANGTLLIQENDKASSPNNPLFRTAAPAAAAKPAPRTGKRGITGNISVNLFQLNGTTLDVQMDGVIARFGNQYSELPTEVFDLEKINNFNENLSLVRNNRYLSIESRPFPKVKDTLSLPFWGLSNRSYALQIATNGLAGAIMSAFLVDEFTQTQTLIDLTQPVFQYNFAVTTNAASKSLTRFRIVFNASPSLPVTFTDLKATQNNQKVRVDWSVGTESELEGYEVERSTDGVVFSKIGFVPATGNSNYSYADLQPASGMNYYRIRSVDLDGSFKFSRIVSVSTMATGGIQVYPAQVVNNQVTVQMNAIPAGAYRMQLTSASGQVVFAGMVQHNGGSSSQILDLSKANAKQGVYFLTLTNGAELRETFKLIF